MSTDFDPYHKWLGIPPEEQPPHHYRLLAIKAFEEDPDVIEAAADQRMAHLRTYQTGKNSALSQKLLNEVAAAKVCLLRPEKKAAYDAQLRELLGRQSSGEDTSAQFQALRALDQAIADEIARPLSQRKEQTPEGPPWLALGVVVAVLIACIVAWSLFGRGKTQEVASKAESGQRKAEGSSPPSAVSSQAEARAAQKVGVSAPEGHKSIAQGASPGKSSQEPVPAPEGRMESATPPQPLPKTEGSSPPSAVSRQVKAGAAQKPGPKDLSPKPQDLPSKRPVPSVADQEKPKKEAQDMFRDGYAKAKKPSERTELARTILKKGVETREPAADHFALLCLARDVAISADDDKLAYETIDEIAKSFEIEPLALKADALSAMSKSARSTLTLHKTLCQQALTLGQECLDHDKLDVADTLAKLSYAEAGKVRDKDLVQRCRVLAKGQQEAAKSYATVQDAFKTLQEKPDDPAANLAVGKHLCFSKGDWSKGLLHLAKSDDAKLKALAEDDLKCVSRVNQPPGGAPSRDPTLPASAMKLADGWWDVGVEGQGKTRDNLFLHAGYWYRKALQAPDAATIESKVVERLTQVKEIRRQLRSATASASGQEDLAVPIAVLAEDVHSGFAGGDAKDFTYFLRRAGPILLRSTAIRFIAKTLSPENQSYGQVSLSLDGSNWSPLGTWSPQSLTEAQQRFGGWQTVSLATFRDKSTASEVRIRFKHASGRGLLIERAEWVIP